MRKKNLNFWEQWNIIKTIIMLKKNLWDYMRKKKELMDPSSTCVCVHMTKENERKWRIVNETNTMIFLLSQFDIFCSFFFVVKIRFFCGSKSIDILRVYFRLRRNIIWGPRKKPVRVYAILCLSQINTMNFYFSSINSWTLTSVLIDSSINFELS